MRETSPTSSTSSRRHASARSALAATGLRFTWQREAILSAVVSNGSHPTAEEIHRDVSESRPVSLATVYNTLQALCDAGLCRKVATVDGSCRYDGGTHDHAHLRLTDTGEVIDLPHRLSDELMTRLPPDLLQRIARELDVSLEGLSVTLSGRRPSA